MVREYFFSSTPEFESAMGDDFAHTENPGEVPFIVSNITRTDALVHAPEINFYIQNSKDCFADKISGIKLLYEARATEYDYSEDLSLRITVGRDILLVAQGESGELESRMQGVGYSVRVLAPEDIEKITGNIGRFVIDLRNNMGAVKVDHIVWPNAPEQLSGVRGVYDPHSMGMDAAMESLLSNSGDVMITKFIKHDPGLCAARGKRADGCGKCLTACKEKAIDRDQESREITIYHAVCHGCCRCVASCPSGALDSSRLSLSSFIKICSLYYGRKVLVIPRRISLESLHVNLPEGTLPFTMETENLLDESRLLSLVQLSGNPVIVFSDYLSPLLVTVIDFLNEIFQITLHTKAVLVCGNEEELEGLLADLPNLPAFPEIDSEHMGKREILSRRLALMIGDEDHGEITTAHGLSFGSLTIFEDRCTLCLSCVEACRIGALTAHAEDNTLRFNPSLCTICGNCETTCPEDDCLHMVRNRLWLHPSSFRQNIMARDDLMRCTECGRTFAPSKAVEKIAGILKPVFADDPAKLKTLYCCPNCKVKIMFE